MSYPRQNNLHPWGLIATGVTAAEAVGWQQYAARRLSIQ